VLLGSNYGVSCDVWSVGVITYILLSAHIPFDGDDEGQVFERILSGTYTFPSPIWDNVSSKAKDFVSKIFIVDPKVRMTAAECLDHPWLNMSGEKPSAPLNNNLLKHLGEWNTSQRDLRNREKATLEFSSASSEASDDVDWESRSTQTQGGV